MQFVTFVTRRLAMAAGGVAIAAAMLAMTSVAANAAQPSAARPAIDQSFVAQSALQPNAAGASIADRRGDAALQGLPTMEDPAAVVVVSQAITAVAAMPAQAPFVSHVSLDQAAPYQDTNHHVSGGGMVVAPSTNPAVMAGLVLVLVLSAGLTVQVARGQRV